MPCNGCNGEEEKPVGKFRFTGGGHLKKRRGPFLSYETGKTYVLPMRYDNKEAYPYWELVEGNLDTEAVEEAKQEEEEDAQQSPGLQAFKPLDDKDRFYAMSEEALKIYIQGQGGQADGRWGKQRLVEEALKLQ